MKDEKGNEGGGEFHGFKGLIDPAARDIAGKFSGLRGGWECPRRDGEPQALDEGAQFIGRHGAKQPRRQFCGAKTIEEHRDDRGFPAAVLGLCVRNGGEEIVASLIEKIEIHHILHLGAAEQGGELVGDHLAQRVHADAVDDGFLRVELRGAIDHHVEQFALVAAREAEAMKIRRAADGLAPGPDLPGDPEHQVLHFAAIDFLGGEEIEIVGTAVMKMEEPEGAAAGEKEAPVFREPRTEEIALERRAGARFVPVHERRGGGIPKDRADVRAPGRERETMRQSGRA